MEDTGKDRGTEDDGHGHQRPQQDVRQWHRHGQSVGLALRKELSDWQLWYARAVVVAMALLAGLTVVGFTWLTEYATDFFVAGSARFWWAPLCCGRHFVPC